MYRSAVVQCWGWRSWHIWRIRGRTELCLLHAHHHRRVMWWWLTFQHKVGKPYEADLICCCWLSVLIHGFLILECILVCCYLVYGKKMAYQPHVRVVWVHLSLVLCWEKAKVCPDATKNVCYSWLSFLFFHIQNARSICSKGTWKSRSVGRSMLSLKVRPVLSPGRRLHSSPFFTAFILL